jgi:hypothetical protein
MDHVVAIERLVSRGITLSSLERALRLSPNYLSKVRHRTVKPSFQLAALLVLVERDPSSVLSAIAAVPSPSPVAPKMALADGPPSTTSRTTLAALASALAPGNVRFAFLGVSAHLPAGDGELDLVVHDVDRHALPLLRAAGFLCAHHSSSLFRCRSADANDDAKALAFTLHFPNLPPLSDVFDHGVERKEVRGTVIPVVNATTTALWFLLNRRGDGLVQARALIEDGGVDIAALRGALATLDALPMTTSPYVLQHFDRTLAAERLRAIGGEG